MIGSQHRPIFGEGGGACSGGCPAPVQPSPCTGAPPLLGIVFTCFLLGLAFPKTLVVGEGVGTGEALPLPVSEQDAQ